MNKSKIQDQQILVCNQIVSYKKAGFITIPLYGPYHKVDRYCTQPGKQPCGKWGTISNMEDCTKHWMKQEYYLSDGDFFNVGMPTGKLNGITCVDFDAAKMGEKDGLEKYKEFCDTYGEGYTLTQKTGKGYHLYFKYLEGWVGNTKINGYSIDTRNDTNQCCVEPSIHSERGAAYQWIGGFDASKIKNIPENFKNWMEQDAKLLKRKPGRPKKVVTDVVGDEDVEITKKRLKYVKKTNDEARDLVKGFNTSFYVIVRHLPDLSDERADHYDDWLRVIFLCKKYAENQEDDEAYEEVKEACRLFSSKSEKYDEDNFEDIWDRANSNGRAEINEGSFFMWLKQDAPKIYEQYRAERLNVEKYDHHADKPNYTYSDFENEFVNKKFTSKRELYTSLLEKSKQVFVICRDGKNTILIKTMRRDGSVEWEETTLSVLLKSNTNKTVGFHESDRAVSSISIYACLLSCAPALCYKNHTFKCVFDNHEHGIFNRFLGFKATPQEDISNIFERVKPFLEHIRVVWCRKDPDVYSWVMSWFSFMLFPPKGYYPKTKKCIVLISKPGCGKDLPLECISDYVLGRKYTWKCCGIDSLTGNFNSELENKKLTIISEMPKRTNEHFTAPFEKMKLFIDSEVTDIHRKGQEKYSAPCLNNYIVASNHDSMLHIEKNDRRYVCLELDDCYMQDETYFIPLRNTIKTQKFGDDLYTYFKMFSEQNENKAFLMECTNKGDTGKLVSIDNIIDTPLRRKLIGKSTDKHIQFFDDFLGTGDEEDESKFYYKCANKWVTTRLGEPPQNKDENGPWGFHPDELYQIFLEHHKDNGFKSTPVNKKIFKSDIAKVPQLVKRREKRLNKNRDKWVYFVEM